MLNVFNFNEAHPVRVEMDEHGAPWFAAKDVCGILGYRNGRDAIAKHCRQDGVAKRDIIDGLGRDQSTTFINEGNLYRLIIRSRLPAAERFEAWLMEEVLPSIRQTGSYSMESALSAPVAKPRPWDTLPKHPASPDPREKVGRELIADAVLEFDGYPVRAFKRDGMIRFVAVDCLHAVGYASPNLTLSRLDAAHKRLDRLPDIWGTPRMITTVTSEGAQALLATSRKPRSVRFRQWISEEAYPSAVAALH